MTSNPRMLSKRKLLPLNPLQNTVKPLPYNIKFITKNAIINTLEYNDLNPDIINQYLDKNPTFLENYLMNHTKYRMSYKMASIADSLMMEIHSERFSGSSSNLEIKQNQPEVKSDIILFTDLQSVKSTATLGMVQNRHIFIEKLTTQFDENRPKASILQTLLECLNDELDILYIKLYLMDSTNEKMYLYDPVKMNTELESKEIVSLDSVKSLAAASACYNNCVMYPNMRLNLFPKLSKFKSDFNIMAQPITNHEGSIYGALEIVRDKTKLFNKSDEELVLNYITWTSIALFFTEILQKNSQQQLLNNFIMKVTQTMFANFRHMDNVIMDIMKYAKHIVKAQRSAFFVVEKETQELVAEIFDVGTAEDTKFKTEKSNIRFPIGVGIAGHVAATGEVLNIKDAYNDVRFNRDVDIRTGYRTKTLVTIPVKLQNETVGVLQIVNKTEGYFTESDEEHLLTFGTYCGIALYIAKMYRRIRHSEQRYKVALDVLSYHSGFDLDEYIQLAKYEIPSNWPELSDFFYCPWGVDEIGQLSGFLYMFQRLFGIHSIGQAETTETKFANDIWRFEKPTLMRFILTVKKNYRKVPYHNWSHAFTVGQSIFCILMNTTHQFTLLESLALFIACFCHDLDHRGKTNEYIVKSDVALGSLYSTSTMEHHHFNMTVSILQREDHNVFENMSSGDYKVILGLIKHDILATDLNKFFGNNANISKIVKNNEINWNLVEQRYLFMELCMTATDLSAMYKPWDMQLSFVKVIMQEFWDQGDLEKLAGTVPARMMDRSYNYELPDLEIGFIQFICIPCFSTLNKLVYGLEDALEGLLKNLAQWKILKDLPMDKKMEMFS